MAETIFTKILAGEIPADIVYEDDVAIAFRDIAPVAPVHVLVIPREPIGSVADATEDNVDVFGHLLVVAAKVAEQEGIAEEGYRVVTNIGGHGGQSVAHVHLHVMGGRQLTWPPG